MRKLNLSKCTTNEEVCTLITERINTLSVEALLIEINKDFVFQETAVRAIYIGLSMNMNVFLSGLPGYGKTDVIKAVLDVYKIPYHTLIGYKDMPVDALLGIPDMDKLIKKSEYEINFKKSIFYTPGILILEEFTDILPVTAAVLKDILSERGYRDKKGKTESLISSVLVASNKSASEISSNPTLSALYESRFPIKAIVRWTSYTTDNYYTLLKKRFGDVDKKILYFMAKLFEVNHSTYSNTVSPRLALDSTKVYINNGISSVGFLDINITDIKTILQEANYDLVNKDVDSLILRLDAIVMRILGGTDELAVLLYMLNSLNSLVLKESLAIKLQVFNNKVTTLITAKTNNTKYCKDINKIITLFPDDK